MGWYIGIEMSDHLSSLNPKEKSRDASEKRKARRKAARRSRRRNR